MQVSLVFTNDWELFGEGSGDFGQLQEKPLLEMLELFKQHNARLTLFAEVGQQWAHQLLADQGISWAKTISTKWEALIEETIALGHDVQLHLHPTWLGARHDGQKWHLDFSQWQLQKLNEEKILEVLKKGRKTLEDIGKRAHPDYQCVAFRAGAFCIQPESKTIPPLMRSGIRCDSSVVPGLTDHLFFDFRKGRKLLGSYLARQSDLCQIANRLDEGILELPIHTAEVLDFPILRRLIGSRKTQSWQFGISSDDEFERWAQARDKRSREIYPAERHPLKKERKQATRGLRRWLGALIRKSTVVLDYDQLSPNVFTAIAEKACEEAAQMNRKELVLVSLGHSKNMHSVENLDRILSRLKSRLGPGVEFKTVRQVVESTYA